MSTKSGASVKTSKNLWISKDLADEFDLTVDRLAKLLPFRVDTGEVGAAALLHFCLMPIDLQAEALKRYRVMPLDQVIQALRRGESLPEGLGSFDVLAQYVAARQVVRRAARRSGRSKSARRRGEAG